MTTLSDIIVNKDQIIKWGEAFALRNLRIFKGVVPKEEGYLNLLADLDWSQPGAQDANHRLLEVLLEETFKCPVTVCFEDCLHDNHKARILANNATLSGLTQKAGEKIFGGNIEFSSLNDDEIEEDYKEIARMDRQTYMDRARQLLQESELQQKGSPTVSDKPNAMFATKKSTTHADSIINGKSPKPGDSKIS